MAGETLGTALRQIGQLFAEGVLSGLSDAQLLDRFVEHRDPSAFEALVARHGPMVLSVCRGMLRDPNDAEDAFQAAFLVMVKKAKTLRARHSLRGWLYQVAHRIAIQANTAAGRRRAHEREAGQMASTTTSTGLTLADALLPALHEEIARLPEKFRLAVVLCDLDELPQAQAASELGWSERTLRRRLAEARNRLKVRLGRRGSVPDDAALAAIFLGARRVAVPPALQHATVRAAVESLNQVVAAGTATATAHSLAHEVLKSMLLEKLGLSSVGLLIAGVTAWAASAAFVATRQQPPTVTSAPAVTHLATRARPHAPEPAPNDSAGIFPVAGRVVDPDGKPVNQAAIYVNPYRFNVSDDGKDTTDRAFQSGRVAATDAEGRFHFGLDTAASEFPFGDTPAWHDAQIAAVAPGFGPAWVTAGSLLKGGAVTLRLVRDDVPIHGQILDSQGRAVPGAVIRADELGALADGLDPDQLLASGEMRYDQDSLRYLAPTWLGRQATWTADRDGRFEITGIGRDRIVGLKIEAAGMAHSGLCAMARPSRATPKPRPRPSRKPDGMMFYGNAPLPTLCSATFSHILVSCKPIVGVVREKGTGQPVAGVNVTGIEPATWTWVQARTDAGGRFQLIGLPKAGMFQVRVNPRTGFDPYLTATTTVTDTEGLRPIETTVEVPRGVVITGRLIDAADGRAVPAKHVTYVKLPSNPNEGYPETGHSGRTDPAFRMTVPPGEGLIYANVRGRETPYVRARLRKADKGRGIGGPGDGEPSTILLNAYNAYKIIDVPRDARDFNVDLELARGQSVTGRVVDPDGKPVVGAVCYGLSSTWGFVKTLSDATFEAHGLEPGHPRQLVFAHRDRRLVGSTVIDDEVLTRGAPLEVRLGRPGSLKGRLVEQDGLPLAGAELSVMSVELNGIDNLPGGHGGVWPDDQTFQSDGDGRFEVQGLKPGVKCFIGVKSPTRPNLRLDTGGVFRNVVLGALGEVRDLGDVKVKAEPQ